MANQADYLTLLQIEIQQKHKCAAVHRESVHVHETQCGHTIWRGEVEVFDLMGNAETDKCYAWTHSEMPKSGSVRLITVLGKRPIDSALMAVRAAIFYNVQPAPMRDIF